MLLYPSLVLLSNLYIPNDKATISISVTYISLSIGVTYIPGSVSVSEIITHVKIVYCCFQH